MSHSEPEGTPGRGPTAAQARAAAEEMRARRRAERDRQLSEFFGPRPPGRAIVATSWVATVLLAVVSVLALLDGELIGLFFMVTFAMFVLGALVLAADVVFAVVRSTGDAIGIGGLFFALDSAPRAFTRALNGSLAAAVVISVVTPVLGLSRPELAFGTLAPLLQISLTGLWCVRHGLFPPREQREDPTTGGTAEGTAAPRQPGGGDAD